MKYITENELIFETTVMPISLTGHLFRQGHDELGYNSSTRAFMVLRRLFYCKGLKSTIYKYVKQCKYVNNDTRS